MRKPFAHYEFWATFRKVDDYSNLVGSRVHGPGLGQPPRRIMSKNSLLVFVARICLSTISMASISSML